MGGFEVDSWDDDKIRGVSRVVWGIYFVPG